MAVKRICIFMHRFDGGGAEKMTVILANELHRRGHKVVFCVRYDRGETRRLLDERIPVLDMKVSETSKIRKNLKNVIYLRQLMAKAKFDILLCVTAEMSQVAMVASWLNPGRMPVAAVIHNTLSQETHSFQKIRNMLFPLMDKSMDGVIAVSEAVREDYIRLCRADESHVFTAYNPVVFEEIFQMAGEETGHPWLERPRSWKTLVLAGRLSYQKNHQLMLQALHRLRREGDWRLILLGIGELEEELRQLCRRLHIEEWVDFRGYVNNPYAYFAAADCVVLSSRFEGLPTVLIEALACGSTIVSVDCPSGPREILGDGVYGTLVPTDDSRALAEGIKKAVSRKADKEKLISRSLDFSVEKSADRYLEIIDRILQGRR